MTTIRYPDSVATGPLPSRAVLLAGGQGTRLGSITRSRPKPLLRVQGAPVITRLIAQLRAAGVDHCTVVTCHLAELVEAELGDGRDLGVRIDYLREHKPLGTAGCLGLLERPDRSFYLLNADIVADLSFRTLAERHLKAAAAATVAVWRHTTAIDYGVVSFDPAGRVTRFQEKPMIETFVAMGMACLTPRACGYVGRGEPLSLPDLLARLMAAGETVASHRHDGVWCDIGRPEDYERAQRMLLAPVASPARRRVA